MPCQISRGYSVCIAWPLRFKLVRLDELFVWLSASYTCELRWIICATLCKRPWSLYPMTHSAHRSQTITRFYPFLSFQHHFLSLSLFVSYSFFLSIPHTHLCSGFTLTWFDLQWKNKCHSRAQSLTICSFALFPFFYISVSIHPILFPQCKQYANLADLLHNLINSSCETVFNQPFLSYSRYTNVL